MFVCLLLFYQVYNTNNILNYQETKIQNLYLNQEILKDSIEILNNFNNNFNYFSIEGNKNIDLDFSESKRFKNKIEDEIKGIKKEKEDKKYSEKLIFNFHMLKITEPISLDLIKNKIEKELNDESNPMTKKNALYELIYYLGKKGDDESVKYLGELLSRKDLDIGPNHPIYNSVVKALGFSRNPKGFDILYDKLKNDSRIMPYQKNFYFYKSLGLMMENNPDLVEKKINNSLWLDFLPEEESIRSCTSICLKIKKSVLEKYETDKLKEKMNNIFSFLEENNIAYDINSYRDAPIGIRIWGGATVNERDIDILLDWLEWCFIKFIKE